ncbi:MAG: hypothetical protein AUJ96_00990 [Armatimonadetes bacterium CG2_30_66_41]|nr:MAG: hypothetical protein AUJ96_00990 [Armatimonadetes bacterium CG2_30_66_41]
MTVTDGVWETRNDNRFTMDQAIRLGEGQELVGLELGRVYYVSEVLDSRQFKVSATAGGPTISNAAIGSGGSASTK